MTDCEEAADVAYIGAAAAGMDTRTGCNYENYTVNINEITGLWLCFSSSYFTSTCLYLSNGNIPKQFLYLETK